MKNAIGKPTTDLTTHRPENISIVKLDGKYVFSGSQNLVNEVKVKLNSHDDLVSELEYAAKVSLIRGDKQRFLEIVAKARGEA